METGEGAWVGGRVRVDGIMLSTAVRQNATAEASLQIAPASWVGCIFHAAPWSALSLVTRPVKQRDIASSIA